MNVQRVEKILGVLQTATKIERIGAFGMRSG